MRVDQRPDVFCCQGRPDNRFVSRVRLFESLPYDRPVLVFVDYLRIWKNLQAT